MKVITKNEARKQGFIPLAGPYSTRVEREQWLPRVVTDLERGNIPSALVQVADNGIEVWRSKDGLAVGKPPVPTVFVRAVA